jgi:hypothetical protein
VTARARRLACIAWAFALCAACGESPAPANVAAPVTPRATAVLEPPQIRIGDRAALEVAVVTPPGYRSLPITPPEEVAGFEILGAEALPVQKEPSRWVHRTRVHLRAREVGRFAWPEGSVQVAAPDGAPSRLPLAPLRLEVVSVLPEVPDRVAPFGARPAPRRGGATVALPAAALGSLLTLAAVGLVVLARRRIGMRAPAAVPPAARAEPPWTAARGDLDRSRAALATDPAAAADATATALRRYMARRFGAAAEARTTEELEIAAPPFAATSRWPVFVSLLRELDALRFRPPPSGAERSTLAVQVEALVSRAEEFVEESTPPEPLR